MLNQKKDNIKHIIPDIDTHKSGQQEDDNQDNRPNGHGNALHENTDQTKNSSHNVTENSESKSKMEMVKLVSHEDVDNQETPEQEIKEISPSPTVQEIVPQEVLKKESQHSVSKNDIYVKPKKTKENKKSNQSESKDNSDSDNGKNDSSESEKDGKSSKNKLHSKSKSSDDEGSNQNIEDPIDKNE